MRIFAATNPPVNLEIEYPIGFFPQHDNVKPEAANCIHEQLEEHLVLLSHP